MGDHKPKFEGKPHFKPSGPGEHHHHVPHPHHHGAPAAATAAAAPAAAASAAVSATKAKVEAVFKKHGDSLLFLAIQAMIILTYGSFAKLFGWSNYDADRDGPQKTMDLYLSLLVGMALFQLRGGVVGTHWLLVVAVMLTTTYVTGLFMENSDLQSPESAFKTVGNETGVAAVGSTAGLGLICALGLSYALPSLRGAMKEWIGGWVLRALGSAAVFTSIFVQDTDSLIQRRWYWGALGFMVFSVPNWVGDVLSGISWGIFLQDVAAYGVGNFWSR